MISYRFKFNRVHIIFFQKSGALFQEQRSHLLLTLSRLFSDLSDNFKLAMNGFPTLTASSESVSIEDFKGHLQKEISHLNKVDRYRYIYI